MVVRISAVSPYFEGISAEVHMLLDYLTCPCHYVKLQNVFVK